MGSEAEETARFADYFDKFFDAVNVSNFVSGKEQRKPFKDPYRSGSDFQLKVTMFKYLNAMKHSYSYSGLVDVHT